MTPEELFEQNMRLGYWCLSRYFYMYEADEDAQQQALIGLWKACLTYNHKRARFATYAIPCINNEVRMWLRKSGSVLPTVSIDDELPWCEGATVAETVPDPNYGPEEKVLFKESLSMGLSDRERALVRCALQGMTQGEMAAELGLSQSYCSRLLKALKKRYIGG